MDGLGGPPTDLTALARRMDVEDIRRDGTMLVAGELRELPEGLVVFLLPNLTRTRRRFTLAHELGHVFFERTGRRPRPSRELERLCDKFAAAFLMPRRAFVSHAGRRPDLARVRELCQIFDTGLLSTLGRVSDLYRYRAIELNGHEVSWRRRIGGPLLPQVTERIRKLSGPQGIELIDVFERGGYSTWELEWAALEKATHKICLLRPFRDTITASDGREGNRQRRGRPQKDQGFRQPIPGRKLPVGNKPQATLNEHTTRYGPPDCGGATVKGQSDASR